MTLRWALPMFLLAYILLAAPFADFLARRPVEVKLGYLPQPEVIRLTMTDHGPLVAELAVVKVLFYFGTLAEKLRENVIIRPEQANMFKTLSTASRIDPYNSDAYYFAQAAFTWEEGKVREVNELLEWGVKHRQWDSWLYFYLGFNHAYFLKEYDRSAKYFKKAAELSGNPLFANLAARYFYESQQTELGLVFLETMIAKSKDPAVRETYQKRRSALLAVAEVEKALAAFRAKNGKSAKTLEEMRAGGFLQVIPQDPYGGVFYIDDQGRVRTSSKFANVEQ